MYFLDRIIELKNKKSDQDELYLDDSIMTIVKRSVKTAGLIMSIIILSGIGIFLAVKALWMIPNFFLIAAAILVFIVGQNKKSEFLYINGLFLLLGNFIGIFGSALGESVTAWSFFFQLLAAIFGICLVCVADKMDRLERYGR